MFNMFLHVADCAVVTQPLFAGGGGLGGLSIGDHHCPPGQALPSVFLHSLAAAAWCVSKCQKNDFLFISNPAGCLLCSLRKKKKKSCICIDLGPPSLSSLNLFTLRLPRVSPRKWADHPTWLILNGSCEETCLFINTKPPLSLFTVAMAAITY